MFLPEQFAYAWSFPALPCTAIGTTWVVYLRGWRRTHRTRSAEMPPWRAVCFSLGLASLWIALCSPIDALDDLLLAAHMTQHFILMSVAPPLLVLGAPIVPLLCGLPRWLVRFLVPAFGARWIRSVARLLVHPVTAWIMMNAAYLIWHVPSVFELALRSEKWHGVEHLCFFGTSLVFWWIVIQPWPSHAVWSRWMLIPYLLAADLVNTALSAFLAFSGRVLYCTYAAAPRISRLSALNDQVAAGAGMWFFGSCVFLVAAAIVVHLELANNGGALHQARHPSERLGLSPQRSE